MTDDALYQAVQMARCDVIGAARATLQFEHCPLPLKLALQGLREALVNLDEARRKLDAAGKAA